MTIIILYLEILPLLVIRFSLCSNRQFGPNIGVPRIYADMRHEILLPLLMSQCLYIIWMGDSCDEMALAGV